MITSRAGDAGGGMGLGARGALQGGGSASLEFPISLLTQPRFGAKINFTTLKFFLKLKFPLRPRLLGRQL